MYAEITSRTNEKIKNAVKLASSPAARRQAGQFFAEGKKLCFDLAQSFAPQAAFFTKETLVQSPDVAALARENYLVAPHVAEKLSTTAAHQGVFCTFALAEQSFEKMDTAAGILVCEEMQDPANVGAVVRTAAGLGFGGVVFCQNSADAFSPRALRASSGAAGRIPIAEMPTAADVCGALSAGGVTLYAAALEGGRPLREVVVQRPFALLIGNEGAGLSAEALGYAHQRVYLPMHRGVESLNAAAAAAICMFYFAGQ